MDRKGFTLLELMLIVVIVGIIATFAIPGYFGVKQRAEGRQASTQVRLLSIAVKIRHLESDSYRICNDYAQCNVRYDLDLPDDGWRYWVVCRGGCNNDFRARARDKAGTGSCTYEMRKNYSKPTDRAGCVYQIP